MNLLNRILHVNYNTNCVIGIADRIVKTLIPLAYALVNTFLILLFFFFFTFFVFQGIILFK